VKWPKPVAGQVIRYSYLWRREAAQGREEGSKDRPCAVVFAVADGEDRPLVVVVPVTHSQPANPAVAIEIPASTKSRLGLDDARSWIVLDESNAFRWPGPDLRPAVNGDLSSVLLGMLPPSFFKIILETYKALEAKDRAIKTTRTE
jgi:mRNA-degrading endonuclease toxin of MazEF toxin-antitoxin module